MAPVSRNIIWMMFTTMLILKIPVQTNEGPDSAAPKSFIQAEVSCLPTQGQHQQMSAIKT